MKKHYTSDKTDTRRFTWFDLTRIILGIVLIRKAVHFLRDTDVVQTVLGANITGDAVIIVILSTLTLLTGFLIMIGRFTKIASLVQLPVFILGTLFIHAGHVERNGFELGLTIIIPFMLLVFITKDYSDFDSNNSKRMLKKTGAFAD